MKRIDSLLLFVLIATQMLLSCGYVKNKVQENFSIRVENSMVDNVYQHINMDYFHGFMDRQTIEDLLKYHGKPDSIFDAYEETTIEGYDIYQYRFEDGNIDCYIPNTEGKRKIVEYIYFEPQKDLDITSIVRDKHLIQQIHDSGADVYYVADNMRVFVRLRINSKDNNLISNIALNDLSFLEEKYVLSDFVSDLSSNLPIEYGQLGILSGVELRNDTLLFSFLQEDINEADFLDRLEKVKDADKKIIIYLFGPTGNINHLVEDIIEQSATITVDIMTKLSGIHKCFTMSNTDFTNLFTEGVASNDILMAYLSINNLSCPISIKYDDNNVFEVGALYVKDSILIYPLVFKMDNKEVMAAVKQNFQNGLLDIDNPDKMIIYHAVRDNKTLTLDFVNDRSKEHEAKVLSRNKTIKLYQSIKTQSQNE